MKPSTPQLNALLATRQFGVADLYTFSLVGGTLLRYTSYACDILWDGDTYSCGGMSGPFLERAGEGASVRWGRGLEVQSIEFSIVPGAAQINSVGFAAAVRNGVFDGADVLLSRAYFATPATNIIPALEPVGVLDLFRGNVGDINPAGRSMMRFQVGSYIERLNTNLPRNLYQPGCLNTLFDTACTLVAADFDVAGTVGVGSTAAVVRATLGEATGYFDLGKIVFTSGLNNGYVRMVKTYTVGAPGSIAVLYPLPSIPQAGDTFTIYPGCDKLQGTCETKFNNLPQFRATPYVPQPELAA